MSAAAAPGSSRGQEFGRSWKIVAAATYGTALGASAVQAYPLPYFMPAIQESFGWTRTEISAAVSFGTFALAIVHPIAGRLCDRFGSTRVIALSILVMSMCTAALSIIAANIHLFVDFH